MGVHKYLLHYIVERAEIKNTLRFIDFFDFINQHYPTYVASVI